MHHSGVVERTLRQSRDPRLGGSDRACPCGRAERDEAAECCREANQSY
jgi:hypothetical protein